MRHRKGSNPRPCEQESDALQTELSVLSPNKCSKGKLFNGSPIHRCKIYFFCRIFGTILKPEPMLHTKFQDHRTSGSGEEDF